MADLEAIPVDSAIHLTIEGNRNHGGSNFGASCMTTGSAPEVVYRLDVVEEVDLVVHLEARASVPTLYLRSVCGVGNDLACTVLPEDHGKLIARDLAPGSYYLFVDGIDFEGAADLSYQLTLSIMPPDPTPGGESCAEVVALELPEGSRRLDLFSDLALAGDEMEPFCGRPQGPEQVYSLTLAEPSRLVVDWSAESADGGLALLGDCDAAARPVGCIASADGRIDLPRAPAGTYFLVAQASAQNPGIFLLGIGVDEPAAPAGNDTCAGAAALPFVAENDGSRAVVQGDLALANGDYATGCSALPSGADLVYAMDFPGNRDLIVTLETDDFPGVVALRPMESCTGNDGGQAELLCAASGEPQRLRGLAAGSYALVVDSLVPLGGSFTLTVDIRLPSGGDTCEDPLPLQLDAQGHAFVEGSTANMHADHAGSCGNSAPGPEQVYHLHLDQSRASGTFTMLPTSDEEYFDTVLYVRQGDCVAGTVEGCNDDTTIGGVRGSRVSTGRLPAGDYYIFADAYSASGAGPYSLEVQLGPPPPPANDTCATAAPLSRRPADPQQTLSVDLAMAGNDLPEGSCWPEALQGGGEDAVYVLEQQAAGLLRVAARAIEPGDPALRLLGGSCDGDEVVELACGMSEDGRANLLLRDLPAGTYWLVVDAASAQRGRVEFTLSGGETPPPPANDGCESAEPVALEAGAEPVRVEADLISAGDDLPSGSCAAPDVAGGGADAVYELTLADPLTVLITGEKLAPGGISLQLLGGDCAGEQAEEIGCAPPGAAPELFVPWLEAGTYWLVVSAASGLTEGYAVTFTTWEAPDLPENESCDAPTELSWTDGKHGPELVVEGNHMLALDDEQVSCGGEGGGDVVYSFTVEQAMSLFLEGSSGAPWSSAIYSLRSGGCMDGEELHCGRVDEPAFLRQVEPGEYWLVIDTPAEALGGPFTLTLTAGPALIPGNNDTCAQAMELSFNESGFAIVFSSNADAANDTRGSCAGNGPELVYTFHLDQPRGQSTFTLDASEFDQWDTVIHLRQGACEAEGSLACQDDSGASYISRITLDELSPGDYFLFADAYWADEGGMFLLTAQLGPVLLPPTNETCEQAISFGLQPEPGVELAWPALHLATDDSAGSCGGEGGGDAVYRFHTDEAVTIALTRPAEPGDLVVYLRRTPDDGMACADAEEIACELVSGNALQMIELGEVEPGDYDLYVDAAEADAHRYHLAVMTGEPPVNDSCAGALAVETNEEGAGSFSGLLRWAADDAAGSCSQPGQKDMVYHFSLAEAQGLGLRRAADDDGSLTVFIRRGGCAPGDEVSEVFCGTFSGANEQVASLGFLQPGDYYVWVEAASSLNFTLDLVPLDIPANDSCEMPVELVFNAAGRATAHGDTTWARPLYSGSCTSAAGNDLVYTFHLDRPRGRSSFSMDAPSNWDTVLYLKKGDCAGGRYIGCDDDGDGGIGTSDFTVAQLGPGDYYLFADGFGVSGKGEFDLTVTLGPELPQPANDACGDGVVEVEDGPTAEPGTEIDSNTLGLATNDDAGSCGGERGGELVYRFPVDQAMHVALTGGSSEADLTVWVRRDACEEGEEVFCGIFPAGQQATRTLGRLVPGDYYLFVDSEGADSFRLTLLEIEPPANDRCEGAEPMEFDEGAGIWTASSSLRFAMDDLELACGVSEPGMPSPDLAYTVDLPPGTFALVHPGGDGELTASLRKMDCVEVSEVLCHTFPGDELSAVTFDVPGGDYLLYVESSEAEDFVLQLMEAVPPANESCASAELLARDEQRRFTARGNLLFAADDHVGGPECGEEGAAELVYALELEDVGAKHLHRSAQAGEIHVWLAPDPCGSEPAFCTTLPANLAANVQTSVLAAGSWYLFVESGGAAEFELQLEDTVPLAGDICENAVPLVFDEQGHADVQADTTHAANDYRASLPCYGGSGNDLVYTFALAAPVRVVAETHGDLDTVLYLHRTPCGLAESSIACNDDGGEDQCSLIDEDDVPAGVYYLIVDGYFAYSNGPVRLTVDIDPPEALAD